MEKIKTALRAFIGYAGSSENPGKMSLRFMAIITAAISQFAPVISFIVVHFGGENIDPVGLTNTIEPIVLSVACVMWLVGAVRAILNTPKVAGFFDSI